MGKQMLFGYFNFFLKTNLIIINCPFFNQSYFNYSCMQYLYLYNISQFWDLKEVLFYFLNLRVIITRVKDLYNHHRAQCWWMPESLTDRRHHVSFTWLAQINEALLHLMTTHECYRAWVVSAAVSLWPFIPPSLFHPLPTIHCCGLGNSIIKCLKLCSESKLS